MSRAKPERTTTVRADWRRWETTLTADVPAGLDGQPAHPAGSKIVVITAVEIPDVTVPHRPHSRYESVQVPGVVVRTCGA